MSPTTASPGTGNTGDRLARGTVYAVSAQLAAAALGFALVLFLARRLGPDDFGRYGVIISFLAWAEFLVITGIPDAVARAIASHGDRRRAVFLAGLRLEAIGAAVLFGLFWLLAPWFSRCLFGAPELAGPFRLAAIDIPLYALFSLHLGYLRGVRGFARQSWSIGFYAAARFGMSALLVLAGLSLEGALIGNAAGSLSALLLIRLLVSRDLRRSPGATRSGGGGLAAFALLLMAGILLYNALISVDLWMVERLAGDPGEVGLYTAVWNMARTPYFLFMGLSIVLFPALSRLLAAGSRRRSRRAVEEASRLYLLITVPLVAFTSTSGSGLMGLAFAEAYQPDRSGPLFAVLVAGYALLSYGLITNAVLTAAGRLSLVISVNLALLLSQIALTGWLIPRHHLAGAVLATLCVGGLSFLLGQLCLSQATGARLHAPSLARFVLAAVPAAALSLVLPDRGWPLILAYAAQCLVYLTGLFFLGELTWEEVSGYGAQFRSRRSVGSPNHTRTP